MRKFTKQPIVYFSSVGLRFCVNTLCTFLLSSTQVPVNQANPPLSNKWKFSTIHLHYSSFPILWHNLFDRFRPFSENVWRKFPISNATFAIHWRSVSFSPRSRLQSISLSFPSEYFTRFWQTQSTGSSRRSEKSFSRWIYFNYRTSIGFWLSTGILRTCRYFMERCRCSRMFSTFEWISIDRFSEIVRHPKRKTSNILSSSFLLFQFSRSTRRNSKNELCSQRSGTIVLISLSLDIFLFSRIFFVVEF